MVERSARLATALESRGFALPRAPRHRFAPWRAESTRLRRGERRARRLRARPGPGSGWPPPRRRCRGRGRGRRGRRRRRRSAGRRRPPRSPGRARRGSPRSSRRGRAAPHAALEDAARGPDREVAGDRVHGVRAEDVVDEEDRPGRRRPAPDGAGAGRQHEVPRPRQRRRLVVAAETVARRALAHPVRGLERVQEAGEHARRRRAPCAASAAPRRRRGPSRRRRAGSGRRRRSPPAEAWRVPTFPA